MATARAWLGIQYATANRFAWPQLVPWEGDLARTGTLGPAAPQPAADGIVPGMDAGPTDEAACLSLNVWAPETADAGSRPVLVWFHGGSFVVGSSAQRCHDGARIASEQGVVLVTVNYRLGALGFLDTRAIGGDVANLGLHDALAALHWVQDNIAAFGGDPDRVTVFGLSAGGGIAVHLLASAASRGLLHRVIVQSGITDRTLDAERGALVAKSLCEACAVDDLAGLERLPADTIVSAQTAVLPQLLKPVGMMPFHPCIDDDLLDAAPAAAFRAGRGADVPLIAGSTSEEMNLFLGFAPAVARDRLVGRVARYVGVDEVAATAVVERYEAEVAPDGVWPALFTDFEMQVPLRRVLEARASATAPTYAYLFTWTSPAHGAFHAVDLPFTFD
ncbi:MAG: carboxylesterase family protein, partial [Acidimicrobiia bacterium]